jgi:hypothetical protein
MTQDWHPTMRSRTARQPGAAAPAPSAVPTRLKREPMPGFRTRRPFGDVIGPAHSPKPMLATHQTRAGEGAGSIQRP